MRSRCPDADEKLGDHRVAERQDGADAVDARSVRDLQESQDPRLRIGQKPPGIAEETVGFHVLEYGPECGECERTAQAAFSCEEAQVESEDGIYHAVGNGRRPQGPEREILEEIEPVARHGMLKRAEHRRDAGCRSIGFGFQERCPQGHESDKTERRESVLENLVRQRKSHETGRTRGHEKAAKGV